MATNTTKKMNVFYELHCKFYHKLANFFYRKQESFAIKSFHKQGYFILRNFISNDLCEKLKNEFELSPKASSKDLYIKKSLLARRIFNFKKNALIYYDFPKEIFRNYEYCLNPISNMPSLKSIVKNKIIKTASKFMKSKVSVEVSDAYKTLAKKKIKHENASWHVDGDYDGAFKMLVYLTDVTKKTGGMLAVQSLSGNRVEILGKAGTVIIFKSSKILHAGMTPKKDRLCLNFSIYPKIINNSIMPYKKINYVSRYFYFL